MDNLYIRLGKLIKEKRQEKELTTIELSKMLNISTGFLSNLENGKTDAFNLELLLNLCNTLDISILNFLELDAMNMKYNNSEKDIHGILTQKTLQNNVDLIISSYFKCLKKYKYNDEAIKKVTNKILSELDFLSTL